MNIVIFKYFLSVLGWIYRVRYAVSTVFSDVLETRVLSRPNYITSHPRQTRPIFFSLLMFILAKRSEIIRRTRRQSLHGCIYTSCTWKYHFQYRSGREQHQFEFRYTTTAAQNIDNYKLYSERFLVRVHFYSCIVDFSTSNHVDVT